MDGTSTLEGRLNFDVTAITNQSGPADGLLSLADSPLMLAAPAPVTLLIKANEAMKDRVIHIHVGGTGCATHVAITARQNACPRMPCDSLSPVRWETEQPT